MQTYPMVGLALLLAGISSTAIEAGSEVPSPKEVAEQAADNTWSPALNGLRVRLTSPSPANPHDTSLIPLLVEVQNDSDVPIEFSKLWPTIRVLAHDSDGKWLGIPSMGPELGDWAERTGSLAPNEITQLKLSFQSLQFNRPLKVGEKILLQVSAPTQQQRTGQLPIEVQSPPLAISIDNSVAKPLSEGDFAHGWQMDLCCRLDMGLLGGQSLHVDSTGMATLVQQTQRDGKRIDQRLSVALTAHRLEALNAFLQKIELSKISKLPPQSAVPDGGFLRITLVGPSGGSLVGYFPSQVGDQAHTVGELRRIVEALMRDVETLGTDKPVP